MNCEEVRERLQELVDGELSAVERRTVEGHLRDCPACAKEYRGLGEFSSTMLRALAPLRPSGDFSSHVVARVRESQLTAAVQTEEAVPSSELPLSEGTFPSTRLRAAMRRRLSQAGETVRSPLFFQVVASVLASLAFLAGLWLLLSGDRPPTLGVVVEGRAQLRILRRSAGVWKKLENTTSFHSGDRIQATKTEGRIAEEKPPRLLFGSAEEPRAAVVFRSPVTLQVEAHDKVLTLFPTGPGRLRLQTFPKKGGGAAGGRLRLQAGKAWLEIHLGDPTDVEAELYADGKLRVTVHKGAARLGNAETDSATAEGHGAVVPQKGPPAPTPLPSP